MNPYIDPVVDPDLMGGVKKFFGAGEINPNLVDPFVVVSFGGKEVRALNFCSFYT